MSKCPVDSWEQRRCAFHVVAKIKRDEIRTQLAEMRWRTEDLTKSQRAELFYDDVARADVPWMMYVMRDEFRTMWDDYRAFMRRGGIYNFVVWHRRVR